jgi:hypothetical protein
VEVGVVHTLDVGVAHHQVAAAAAAAAGQHCSMKQDMCSCKYNAVRIDTALTTDMTDNESGMVFEDSRQQLQVQQAASQALRQLQHNKHSTAPRYSRPAYETNM